MDKNIKDVMRKNREENFAVIEETMHHNIYDDEKAISITHNGYQWMSFHMTKNEAIKIIDKIKEIFALAN